MQRLIFAINQKQKMTRTFSKLHFSCFFLIKNRCSTLLQQHAWLKHELKLCAFRNVHIIASIDESTLWFFFKKRNFVYVVLTHLSLESWWQVLFYDMPWLVQNSKNWLWLFKRSNSTGSPVYLCALVTYNTPLLL